jgi:Immunoglobulin I-set domain
VSVGGSVQLNVIASGSGPLTYQWFFNDVARFGAQAASLTLNDVQLSDAGSYRVIVSNAVGSVTSIVAAVNVATNTSDDGGMLLFANSTTNRVYDVGGTNLVTGNSSLVVGIFVGSTPVDLQPVGALAHFARPTLFAGRFTGGTLSIPGTSAGQIVSVQIKIWDSADGATYEQAIAAGGKSAISPVFQVTLGGGFQPPAVLSSLPGLVLAFPGVPAPQIAAAAPKPAPVRIVGLAHSSKGWTVTITGPVSATCAIQKSNDSLTWKTIAYIVNESGIVEYTDMETSDTKCFYQVQLLAQ